MENIEKEVWKEVKGYEGYYQISNLGDIKSLSRFCKAGHKGYFRKERILRKAIGLRTGRFYVILSKNKNKKSFQIHRLLAIAFLNYNPDHSSLIVDHIDNNPLNNNVNNLQLITQRLNLSKDKKNKTSLYTGVSWNKANKKWVSRITINNKIIHLGCFYCQHKAYLEYKIKLETL